MGHDVTPSRSRNVHCLLKSNISYFAQPLGMYSPLAILQSLLDSLFFLVFGNSISLRRPLIKYGELKESSLRGFLA